MTYRTTACYVSGAICGHMWMPNAMAGMLANINLRGEFDRMSEPSSFREVLLLVLMEKGGDFQDSAFSADTVVRVERIGVDRKGFRSVHVWEREVREIPDCADLVHEDAYVCDFMGDDD